MSQIYTVNRLFLRGKPTRTVVLNQSNRGPSDAVKYGHLIQKKEVHKGIWVFVGLLTTEHVNASRYTDTGGMQDNELFRLHGIDVRHMRG